jgi:GNAT superfamily N-acetyltransferase
MIFLTSADARRMEAAEEYGALRHAQATHKENPASGVAWEAFGGGHLVFIAQDSPIGRAHGLGFSGQVTTADIEHVEQFYFSHGATARVDVCPYSDPSLFESLGKRGFQVEEFNQTLARWVTPDERFEAKRSEAEIRAIRPEEASTWQKVLAKVFFDDKAAQFESLFAPWAALRSPLCLAAFVGGQMVAGAAGLLVPEYNIAAFFGAATLPEFQGRGIQYAFTQARLKVAQAAGCDLAITLSNPGTTSQRNLERSGFRLAYTKVVVRKSPTSHR